MYTQQGIETERALRSADYILMDTSFFMDMSRSGCREFQKRLEPILRKSGKIIYAPEIVLKEAQHHIERDDPKEPDLARKAKESRYAVAVMEEWYCEGLLKFYKGASDKWADNNNERFIADFTLRISADTLRKKGNVLVLVDDKSLIIDLLEINDIKSFQTPYTIIVKELSKEGWLQQPDCFLEWYRSPKHQSRMHSKHMSPMRTRRNAEHTERGSMPNAEAFRIAVCVNTSTSACGGLEPMMGFVNRLNQGLAQNPTTENAEVGVVGFDDVAYTLCPIHRAEPKEVFPTFPLNYGAMVTDPRVLRFPAGGQTLLSNVALMHGMHMIWQGGSDLRVRPIHSFLILLTDHISPSASSLANLPWITSNQIRFLTLNEILVQQDIMARQRKGELTMIPFCIDSQVHDPVLSVLNSPGFPSVSVSSSQLESCAEQLCQLVQRILTYAPGKAPSIDVPAQFIPGQSVAYQPAPPLEFCPSVLEWEDVH